MLQKFDFYKVTSILRSSDIVSKIEIQNVDEAKGRGVYKIRCNLIPSRYKLQPSFVQTEEEVLYSYQVFTDKPIVRWDNAPHYPKIRTHPHHFHTKDENVIESRLNGNVIENLQEVLSAVKKAIKEHKY